MIQWWVAVDRLSAFSEQKTLPYQISGAIPSDAITRRVLSQKFPCGTDAVEIDVPSFIRLTLT